MNDFDDGRSSDTPTEEEGDERLVELLQLLEAEWSAGADPLHQATPIPEVDLRTLLGEMAALKAAVRAETSSARELRDHLGGATDELRRELERAARRAETLQAEADKARREADDRAASDLIDLADRLEPALKRARELARPRGWWFRRRRDPAAVALREGLELSLQRLTRKLMDRGLSRLKTVGHRFDPSTMEAVEIVNLETLPDGRVVAEVTGGYLQGSRVFRSAQVVVNRDVENEEEI